MSRHLRVFDRTFILLAGTFVTVLIVLLLVGNTANQRFSQITDSLISRDAYQYPIAPVERIRALLGETELSLKAYTFTKNETFLDDYYLNCMEIIDEFDALKADSHQFEPQVNQVLDTLDTLVFKRLDLFESILTSGDEFRVERAMSRVNAAVHNYKIDDREVADAGTDLSSKKNRRLFGFLGIGKEKEEENAAIAKKPGDPSIDSLQYNIKAISERERYRESAIRNVLLDLSEDGKYVSERIDEIISLIVEAEIRSKEQEAQHAAALSEASKIAVKWGIFIAIALVLIFAFMLFIQVREANRLAVAKREASEKALSLAKAKESFIANVSHELRTPLNSIIGFSELIEESKDRKEQESFTKKVKQSARHLNDLIQDLLDWSRLESGRFKFEHVVFSPYEIVGEVQEIMQYNNVNSDVAFTVESAHLESQVLGDPLRLKQILINLLGNAFKFTSQGEVLMLVRQTQSDNQVIMTFVVRDTGPGIPADKLDIIFNDFERVEQSDKKQHQGSGLGLAITKRLVDEQNGKIEVVSEVGKGTEVSVSIPFDIPSQESIESGLLLSGKRILIVDDNDFNLDLLNALLTKEGALVEQTKSGKDAIEILRKQTFDFGIFDLKMPEMDGFELAEIVRRTDSSGLILIALSAADVETNLSKCREAGYQALLKKPVEKQVLFEKLAILQKDSQPDEVDDQKGNAEVEHGSEKPELIIDESQLNRIFEDDNAFRNEMLIAFIASITSEVPRLKEAVESKDNDRLEDILHKIMPSCRQVGAERMMWALQQLKNCMEKEDGNNKKAYDQVLKNVGLLEKKIESIVDELTL